MTVRVPHLPFSLDPLVAEAKRRARQRRMLVALAVLLAGLALGLIFAFRSPGGSPNGGLRVTTGMTAKAVRATAGPPLRIDRSNPRNPDCWVYAWNSAVCFRHGRVDYIGP